VGGPDEAIAVGGSGGRGLVLEWNGERWDGAELPDDAAILWWSWSLPGGDAWAVGERGTVLRRSDGVWRRELVDEWVTDDQTLYGVWGFAPDDVWIVGGTLATVDQPGVILHWDGLTFSGEPAPSLLFKVWGASPGDVWAVGEGGAILRYTAGAWNVTPSPTSERLIAVYGREAADVYAVGGLVAGVVLRWDGADWTSFADAPEGLAGVWTAPGRPLYVGGARGYLARFGTDPASFVPIADVDFHAIAGAGDLVVAVGADFLTGGSGRWRGALASHGPSMAGPIDPPPPPPDAHVIDATPPADAGGPDAFGPGEGEPCARSDGGAAYCREDLDCWLIFADSVILCTEFCSSPGDCGLYGEGACCERPGPQVPLETTVCIPRGYSPCP
jgi:hypothetical protein